MTHEPGRRFFRAMRDAPAGPPAPTAAKDDSAPVTPGTWAARAAAVIPGGASTGSKRPFALYGRDEPAAPTHFVRASGYRVLTADGRELADFTSALGSVALGYADPEVTRAVCDAVAAGTVSGLASTLEVEVAERLCEVVPCAERVRFLKSGAEGVAAAVRLARAATGRDLVLGSGYFGWLDWWSDAPGVPQGVRADFRALPFDEPDALTAAADAAGRRLAAIVLEPVQERLPSPAWMRAARAACDRHGAVLVLDEVKTGFRLHAGGYQAYADVRPDVAVVGKALANGFPLAAVLGRADVMEEARRSWISSTLAGETAALAAARAVLDRHAREDVCGRLWRTGEAQMAVAREALVASGTDAALLGIPPMWFLRHADAARETRVLERLAGLGVLLKRGAYDFPTLAHDDAGLALLGRALAEALGAETLREDAS
ncbi:MAG TPA: aminotransferase class III-fold pyridoxal phosphate-dependent enzyme [Gemmatimonadaceae bacterium]|nr:aminotransferase class III-fold pyridoxal phosphate-dependent enzyme [Gemmatimonadaceae bacterium]